MIELGLLLALQLRDDALSQHLAELDAPLVERVNIPNHPLGENGVFVKGNEFTEHFWCEPLGEYRVRWPVTLEDPMRHEPVRRALSLHLFGRLTERQRLGLSEDICQEHVVMLAQRIEWFGEGDEIARDEPGTLMNQLVERVLPIRSRLAPVDGTGLLCDFTAVECD